MRRASAPRREQSFARQRRGLRPASAATPDAALSFRILHRFVLFRRPFSHIAEALAAGLPGRPGHRSINARPALSGIGRMDRIGGSPMRARFHAAASARRVRRCSAGWLGRGGVGADSGRHGQDRRPERLLRTVRRSGRQGIAGWRSARGRGFRQGGGRPQGRDHFRRSPEQARHRRRDCTAMGG